MAMARDIEWNPDQEGSCKGKGHGLRGRDGLWSGIQSGTPISGLQFANTV